MTSRSCWWCERPSVASFSGLVDGQLLALRLCRTCLDALESLRHQGAVDYLLLQDQLLGMNRLTGEGLRCEGNCAPTNLQAPEALTRRGER